MPTNVIIGTKLEVGTSPSGHAVISINSFGDAKFFNFAKDNEGITIGTNGNVTIDSDNFIVNSDTTINGNLIVNGTQTIINTEIKLIEDSLIELGYAGTNSLPFDQDIGFFGQYTNNNYAGLYYDASAAEFKVFDSLGTNDYETSLATNPNGNTVTTNARVANIVAKNFITKGGDFGQEVFSTNMVIGATTNVSANIVPILQSEDVYGTTTGVFSGKLLSYLITNDFTSSASTLINYTFHVTGTGSDDKQFNSSVELETRSGTNVNFIDFDSINNTITATLVASATKPHLYNIKVLPILTLPTLSGFYGNLLISRSGNFVGSGITMSLETVDGLPINIVSHNGATNSDGIVGPGGTGGITTTTISTRYEKFRITFLFPGTSRFGIEEALGVPNVSGATATRITPGNNFSDAGAINIVWEITPTSNSDNITVPTILDPKD